MRSFLVFLTLCASLSPLLTFAHLWQLKEWRWDRLREHLRHHGWLRQLFGITRPAIMLFFFILIYVSGLGAWDSVLIARYGLFVALISLSILNILQIILRRQPFPIWTKKAITLVITSLLLTALFSYPLSPTPYPLFLPLLQPFFLSLSLTLFSPLDSLLKHRILKRAQNLRSQYPHLTAIGITGSAGKTTTKELLAHLLHKKNILVTPEHVNTEMGVAQWLIKKLPPGRQELLIVEMGAYKKGEIRTLCDITKPSIGIITSIGTQHLALFGSQKNLLNAKAELIDALPKNGHLFINADSPYADSLIARSPCAYTEIVGQERSCPTISGVVSRDSIESNGPSVCATQIEEKPDGLHFKIDAVSFFVPLHGLHNITNVLLAIAAAEFLGLSREDTALKLRTFEPPPKTFSVREERGIEVLDNTHNLSPESFRESIQWARNHKNSPKILLTSGIIELGEKQDAIHEELGKTCKDIFDRVIFLDKRSAKHFAKGLGSAVEIFSPQIKPISKGSLLVCNGRMSPRIIQTILP